MPTVYLSSEEYQVIQDLRWQKHLEYMASSKYQLSALRTAAGAAEALAEPPTLYPGMTDEDFGVGEAVVEEVPAWRHLGYTSQEEMRVHGQEMILSAWKAFEEPPTSFHEVVA